MDPSSTPWRAFEAPDTSAGPATPTPSKGPAGAAGAAPRGQVIAIVAATVLLVAGAAWFAGSGTAPANVIVDSSVAGPSNGAQATDVLVIDIGGAVVDPGVYRLPADSRVGDAIAIAGGYGPRVDAGRVAAELNLAAPLTDGQHLTVPSRDDIAPSGSANGPASGGTTTGGLIDLNRATTTELDTLPGIGPVTAAKIVASRGSSPFTTIQDLRDRKLIGQKTFDGLRDLVIVR